VAINNCNPNFSQAAASTRTAWNPHPFLEIGLDLIWFHLQTANAGSTVPTGRHLPGRESGWIPDGSQKTILP
jgi:hypothetical protein